MEDSYYLFDKQNKKFLEKDSVVENKDNLFLIFDLQNLSKKLEPKEVNELINKYEPKNIIIKNSRIEELSKIKLSEDNKLIELFISDELYSMSGKLDALFGKINTNKLTLKNFKINSKLQLEKFLYFILGTNCKELILEDIFIELLIKKDENDETFNILDEYIGFENGKFYIKFGKEKEETQLTKLKLIDCPLFAITDDTFKDINKYKDIEIDIDENSLLNPSIITRFRINKGLSDFCFDLDSYKLNKEGEDDYMENIKYIIDNIIDDNNNEYNKLIFNNFDITKYEYITYIE
jgi:hypothetical protein